MEKFIEVYDDIIPKNLVDYIENLIFKTNFIQWEFNSNISGVEGVEQIGFSSNIFKENLPINNYTFNLLQVLYCFLLNKNFNLKKVINARLFLQPPSPNPRIIPAIHVDNDDPHYVCIYYINDCDGDTVFFNQDKIEIKRVTPKKGRIVFFDGKILHTGSSSLKTRAIINYNFF